MTLLTPEGMRAAIAKTRAGIASEYYVSGTKPQDFQECLAELWQDFGLELAGIDLRESYGYARSEIVDAARVLKAAMEEGQ